METKEYLIALNMIDNLEVHKLKKLLDKFSKPGEIFKASISNLMKTSDIKEEIARNIKNVLTSKRFKDELRIISKENIKIMTIFDDDYPLNLRSIYDPPVVLYIKGNYLIQDTISLAIVGSRKASLDGLKFAKKLSIELAQSNITVISGLARGIDSASHRGALEAGGRTIAILGSGHNFLYPPENKNLYRQVAECGAIISEFPMFMPPRRENFPRRNRVISGLSLGVVVVEARKRSGSLITANFALEQGREVFAVPCHPDSMNSKGTNQLIQDGAKLVQDVDDIIDELKPQLKSYIQLNVNKERKQLNKTEYKKNSSNIENIEKRVYDILSDRAYDVNELTSKSAIDKDTLSASLLSLEIKGLVKKISDGLYIKNDLGD